MENKMEHKMPPMQKSFTCTDTGSGIYDFSAPPISVHQYLVLGSERALLIDTGMGVGSLRPEVEKVTSLPVTVINTHGHPDHAGGNAEFSSALLCPADLDVFERMATKEFRMQDISHMPGGEELTEKLQPTGPAPTPVEDGAVIDLGGRTLRVIYAPGHTHGSLCVYDDETGTLFTGDNAQIKTTNLREWNSSTVEEFAETLRKLISIKPTKLMGGHNPNVNGPDLLDRLLNCAERILAGEAGEPRQMRGETSLVLEGDGVGISYTEKNIRK